MSEFSHPQFMLNGQKSRDIYEAISNLPIFDFHCHLDPVELYENKPYRSITHLWLAGDHYKWRLMRMHGIDESRVTGDASDWEKFSAWAETLENLYGNPLFHWSHMELKTYFGIDKQLTSETAKEIYDECNELLQTREFLPRELIKRSNVAFIGTTDDPISTLEEHRLLNEDDAFHAVIAPTFRPDPALFIERPGFTAWMKKLSDTAGFQIETLDDLLRGLQSRVDYFAAGGGRASDHDIPEMTYVQCDQETAEAIFEKGLKKEPVSSEEQLKYRSYLMTKLGEIYAEKEWVMQLHIGALRNNNGRALEQIGRDAGFDSLNDLQVAEGLSAFLDELDQKGKLPRTVLFNLNPKDNPVLASMAGNFYEAGIKGKVQFGSAWWFNDHIDGMERQMKDLANTGMLTHFIGMLTDSRSMISYVRHDYFRRIISSILGEWMEKGLIPQDTDRAVEMAKNISYFNAVQYFTSRGGQSDGHSARSAERYTRT